MEPYRHIVHSRKKNIDFYVKPMLLCAYVVQKKCVASCGYSICLIIWFQLRKQLNEQTLRSYSAPAILSPLQDHVHYLQQ